MRGRIKWFNESKGYGFIVPDAGTSEAFFHKSGLSTGFQPFEGARVEFDMSEGRKGAKAVNIQAAPKGGI